MSKKKTTKSKEEVENMKTLLEYIKEEVDRRMKQEQKKDKMSTTQVFFKCLSRRINPNEKEIDKIFNMKPQKLAKILVEVCDLYTNFGLGGALQLILRHKRLNAEEKIVAIFLLGAASVKNTQPHGDGVRVSTT